MVRVKIQTVGPITSRSLSATLVTPMFFYFLVRYWKLFNFGKLTFFEETFNVAVVVKQAWQKTMVFDSPNTYRIFSIAAYLV